MAISRKLMLQGAVWTAGLFGVGQFLRVATNIIITRLLAPELFGIMQIVNSLVTGIELITDVGVAQNIIYSPDANEPDFYNTAWTLQLIRGVLLWIVFCAAAIPIARFYHSGLIALVIPIAGINIVLNGLASTSRFLLQKRMQYKRLTVFTTLNSLVTSVALIVFAFFNRTIWSLVFGSLAGTAAATIVSFYLIPGVRNRFVIAGRYAAEIFSFGKWIFASSLIYFLSANFDRLYLAKTVPLRLLGIYGIARALADMINGVVVQLGNNIIFPIVASHSHVPRAELRAQLAPIRVKFLLVVGFMLSALAATGDLVIKLLYDQRYQAAGWMLPFLIIGAWFAVIANLNESTVLGMGRPQYTALGNSAKFCFLLVGLIWSVGRYGIMGGVMVVATADLWRYTPVLIGQMRQRLSFGRQDAMLTLALFAQIALWESVRWLLGFGTSFEEFHIFWTIHH